MKLLKKSKEFKYFFIPMAMSTMFLILVIGLIIAENNTGSLIFGNGESIFEYDILGNKKFIKFMFFGKIIEINFVNLINCSINFLFRTHLDFSCIK